MKWQSCIEVCFRKWLLWPPKNWKWFQVCIKGRDELL